MFDDLRPVSYLTTEKYSQMKIFKSIENMMSTKKNENKGEEEGTRLKLQDYS